MDFVNSSKGTIDGRKMFEIKNNIFGKRQNYLGKLGEAIATKFLEMYNYEIINVTGNQEYRNIDIDLVGKYPYSDKAQTFEIKYSNKLHYNNGWPIQITVEHRLDIENDLFLEGWLWKTDAEILIFCNKYKLYIFKMEQIKQYMLNYFDGYTEQCPASMFIMEDTKEENSLYHGKKKENYGIKISDLIKAGCFVEEWTVNDFQHHDELISFEENGQYFEQKYPVIDNISFEHNNLYNGRTDD